MYIVIFLISLHHTNDGHILKQNEKTDITDDDKPIRTGLMC